MISKGKMRRLLARQKPRSIAATAPLQTGAIYTLPHLLGSTSTFALLDATAAAARGLSAGTNSNLTLIGGNQISATAALTAGASQLAAVEERSADGSVAVARMVTFTGQISVPAAPTVTLTPADGQISIGWADNSNGGAAITAHRIYVNGAGMSPITSASPYVLTGLANDTPVTIEVAAINSAGEGAKSAAQSATPVSLPATPAGFAALPLAAGSRVVMLGDSYVERGNSLYYNAINLTTTSGNPTVTVNSATLANISPGTYIVDSRFPTGTRVLSMGTSTGGSGTITLSANASASSTAASQIVYGKNVDSSNLWSVLRSLDPRFGMEMFIAPSKPTGVSGYAAAGGYYDGTPQGKSGTGMLDTKFAARCDFVLTRNPALVIHDIGKNDINGASATLATMQSATTTLYNKFFGAKVWQVFQTQGAFRNGATPGDWSAGGAQLAVLTAYNDWLVNTVSTWPGVAAVLDSRDLDGVFSVANESQVFAGDKLHLLPYGNWQRAKRFLPTMRKIFNPASVPLQSAADNVFPFKTLSGTNGTKSPGATFTGQVAANMRVGGITGDTAVCSLGTNSDGEVTQIVDWTPTYNGTAQHSVSFSTLSAILFSTVNTALAQGDWVEFSMRVQMDDWAGWTAGDAANLTTGTKAPGLMRAELTDSSGTTSRWLETDGSGCPNATMTMRVVFQLPGAADRFQSLMGITVWGLSNVGGTGRVIFDKPRLRKLAADPRVAWAVTD